jgi:hypothetical protein
MDFIDSFQFMSFSLEKLVDNHVKEGPTKCYHMTEYFGTEKIDLLLRKQIYPDTQVLVTYRNEPHPNHSN